MNLRLQLILDESAVVSYLNRTSLAVGEALGLLLDEKDPAEFGVPVPIVASAAVAARRRGLASYDPASPLPMDMLTGHPAFRPLGVGPEDLPNLLTLAQKATKLDCLLAMQAAVRHDCVLFTNDITGYAMLPEEYRERLIGF